MRAAVVGLVREKVREKWGRKRAYYVCGWLLWTGFALTLLRSGRLVLQLLFTSLWHWPRPIGLAGAVAWSLGFSWCEKLPGRFHSATFTVELAHERAVTGPDCSVDFNINDRHIDAANWTNKQA
jgi:hypothetical protein